MSHPLRPLAELCSYIQRGISPAYADAGGVLVLNQKCIRNNRVDLSLGRRTDPQKKAIAAERFLRPLDILVNSTGVGTLGRVAQLLSISEPVTVDSHVTIVRPNTAVVVPRFLGFAMGAAQGEIEQLGEGSTGQTELSRARLANLRVPCPPIEDQRSIAAVLGLIDEKIELNRLVNQILEAMARAIFKDWFINFGPTRAKMAGAAPYLAAELWELFPDRLDDQGKPDGWEKTTLAEFMSFQGGSQPPASTFSKQALPGYRRLLQIRDFYTSSHVTYVPDNGRLRLVEEDDICIGRYGSGSGDSGDSLGRLCRGLGGAINVALVRVEPKFDCREWLATFIGSGAFRTAISGGSARAVQAGYRKEDLAHISVTRAPSAVHRAFESFGSLVWDKAKAARAENDTLARTRDLLLLELLSGEIRISNAERVLEVAA